ncbi:MAG: hypothetical protein R3E58_01970 [Phycisphaerae bacterium]
MKPDDRDAILYAFAIEPHHDRATFERYLRQYPELAEDLIDIVSERRLRETVRQTASETVSEVVNDPNCEAAWAQLVAASHRTEGSQEVDPFAHFRGKAFVSLAAALDVPRSILAAIRDGLVVTSSLPNSLVERMARAMELRSRDLIEHLTNAQRSLQGRAFKSDTKPTQQEKTTFAELVRNTTMTLEQRDRLLKDCETDGLDGGKPSKG